MNEPHIRKHFDSLLSDLANATRQLESLAHSMRATRDTLGTNHCLTCWQHTAPCMDYTCTLLDALSRDLQYKIWLIREELK